MGALQAQLLPQALPSQQALRSLQPVALEALRHLLALPSLQAEPVALQALQAQLQLLALRSLSAPLGSHSACHQLEDRRQCPHDLWAQRLEFACAPQNVC